MTADNGVRDQVHGFIMGNFLFDTGSIEDDLSLTEEGIIDSTGVLELVAFVEETFSLIVEDRDIVPENFDSVACLTAYIVRKTDDQLAAGANPDGWRD